MIIAKNEKITIEIKNLEIALSFECLVVFVFTSNLDKQETKPIFFKSNKTIFSEKIILKVEKKNTQPILGQIFFIKNQNTKLAGVVNLQIEDILHDLNKEKVFKLKNCPDSNAKIYLLFQFKKEGISILEKKKINQLIDFDNQSENSDITINDKQRYTFEKNNKETVSTRIIENFENKKLTKLEVNSMNISDLPFYNELRNGKSKEKILKKNEPLKMKMTKNMSQTQNINNLKIQKESNYQNSQKENSNNYFSKIKNLFSDENSINQTKELIKNHQKEKNSKLFSSTIPSFYSKNGNNNSMTYKYFTKKFKKSASPVKSVEIDFSEHRNNTENFSNRGDSLISNKTCIRKKSNMRMSFNINENKSYYSKYLQKEMLNKKKEQKNFDEEENKPSVFDFFEKNKKSSFNDKLDKKNFKNQDKNKEEIDESVNWKASIENNDNIYQQVKKIEKEEPGFRLNDIYENYKNKVLSKNFDEDFKNNKQQKQNEVTEINKNDEKIQLDESKFVKLKINYEKNRFLKENQNNLETILHLKQLLEIKNNIINDFNEKENKKLETSQKIIEEKLEVKDSKILELKKQSVILNDKLTLMEIQNKKNLEKIKEILKNSNFEKKKILDLEESKKQSEIDYITKIEILKKEFNLEKMKMENQMKLKEENLQFEIFTKNNSLILKKNEEILNYKKTIQEKDVSIVDLKVLIHQQKNKLKNLIKEKHDQEKIFLQNNTNNRTLQSGLENDLTNNPKPKNNSIFKDFQHKNNQNIDILNEKKTSIKNKKNKTFHLKIEKIGIIFNLKNRENQINTNPNRKTKEEDENLEFDFEKNLKKEKIIDLEDRILELEEIIDVIQNKLKNKNVKILNLNEDLEKLELLNSGTLFENQILKDEIRNLKIEIIKIQNSMEKEKNMKFEDLHERLLHYQKEKNEFLLKIASLESMHKNNGKDQEVKNSELVIDIKNTYLLQKKHIEKDRREEYVYEKQEINKKMNLKKIELEEKYSLIEKNLEHNLRENYEIKLEESKILLEKEYQLRIIEFQRNKKNEIQSKMDALETDKGDLIKKTENQIKKKTDKDLLIERDKINPKSTKENLFPEKENFAKDISLLKKEKKILETLSLKLQQKIEDLLEKNINLQQEKNQFETEKKSLLIINKNLENENNFKTEEVNQLLNENKNHSDISANLSNENQSLKILIESINKKNDEQIKKSKLKILKLKLENNKLIEEIKVLIYEKQNELSFDKLKKKTFYQEETIMALKKQIEEQKMKKDENSPNLQNLDDLKNEENSIMIDYINIKHRIGNTLMSIKKMNIKTKYKNRILNTLCPE